MERWQAMLAAIDRSPLPKVVTVAPADNMQPAFSIYRSYLVRLWQEHPLAPWRASAQSVQTGETVRFADLDQLFAFFLAQAAPNRTNDDGAAIRS